MQDREAARRAQRPVERADHLVVVHLGARDLLAERPAGDRRRIAVDEVAEAGEERAQPAGVVQILHQEAPAGADVADHRSGPRKPVEGAQVERHLGTAGERDEVDHGVRRAAEREHRGDRVLEGARAEQAARADSAPRELHGPSTAGGGHAAVIGVDRGDRRCAGERHPERVDGGRHRRRGAHRHAVPVRACDAVLELAPCALAQDAGLAVGPGAPHVRAAAEHLPPPVAAQHRPRGHEDGRQVERDRGHQERRRGLVAPAHQHRAVDRVAPQHLLRLDREQVAEHHRRGLLERLGERHHRHLDREAAGGEDAAAHGLGALAEVPVAAREIAPGVDDGDHRPPRELLERVAELLHPRAMREAAQRVGPEPALAAELLDGTPRAVGHG